MTNLLLLFVISLSVIKTSANSGLEISFTIDELDSTGFGFAQASWLNSEGEPNLPCVVYRIGIPQDGSLEVVTSDKREKSIKGAEVKPVIMAAIHEGPEPQVMSAEGVVYDEDKFFPESIVEVSSPGYFRDIYTATVRLNPVRYNPVTKEVKVVDRIRIRVNFQGAPKSRAIIDQSFETIYENTLVNYDQCRTWRREPKSDGRNQFSSGVWFKIEIAEEGLYKIDYNEIGNVGLDPSQFDPKTMKIYTAAFDLLSQNVAAPFADSLVQVPVYVQGEDDNAFDQNDYLIFYGYPASHFVPDSEIGWYENGYARNNVYWFTFGGSDGTRMAQIDAAYSGGALDTLVNEIMHIEEDHGNPTRSGTNWYWQDISPGQGETGSGTFSVQHLRARGQANVKVGIFTMSAATFWYRLIFDNETFFSDTLNLGAHTGLPPAYLSGDTELIGDSSDLTISITRPLGTSEALTAYLNSIDIRYERVTDLASGFHAFYSTPQEYSIQCTNATSEPFVLDITDLRQPKIFNDMSLEGSALRFSSQCDSFQLLYCTKFSLAKPVELIPSVVGELKTPSAGCEYLCITHKNFTNAITPLINYRSQEYSTKVVVLDDIFNDFSYGKYDPLAIKHFLYYTTNNWTTVPKYVLLVGDATSDFKNNRQSANPPNFIPMYESGSTLSGNPGIPPNYIYEGEYVNFGAGEVMILGRITARTNQEVRDFIDKVLTYETGAIDGMWNKRIVLAGDDEHSNSWGWADGIQHVLACEQIIVNTPNSFYDFAKIYMVSYPPFTFTADTKKENAQKQFITELNRGALAGVFYGHGNTHQMADEGLFYDTKIPEIHNGRRYFLFYFASCTIGRFNDYDYECIGEQFVRIKEGAIGTMAATSGTGPGTNETIGQRLFDYVTDPDTNLTMGECCFLARSISWGSHYLLLGDPATRLRRINSTIGISATPDSLRPLQNLKIDTDVDQYYVQAFVRDTTHIPYFDDNTIDDLASHVFRVVGQPPTPFDYSIDGKEIYHGFWVGETAQVIVPKITTTHLPIIKSSAFVLGRTGMLDSTRVYGLPVISPDQIGPEIVFYDRAKKLSNGDWVTKDFTLTGKVTDQSGVNLLYSVDNSRGFFLYINQETDKKTDLRNYFIYDRNSFTSGEFNCVVSLPRAVDTITVNVADNNDKQSVTTIILNAEVYGQIAIENFLVYPNPLRKNQGLWFTFDLTNNGLVTLKIFTIAGHLIKTVQNVSGRAGYNQVAWDGLDEYGDEISNGVYLVKAIASGEDSKAELVEKFIVAR